MANRANRPSRASRRPVIVGTGLSDYPKAPHLSAVQHHALATQRALADAGLAKSDIDGFISCGMGGNMSDDPATMAEYLGIDHRYIDGTMVGGSSYEFHVQHGANAIRTGLCDTVLVTYGSDYLSRMGRALGTGGFHRDKVAGPTQFEAPYGNSLVGAYAMVAQRHMHDFGTTSEQLAEIAVGVREHAGLNPSAMHRKPISVEDVLSSRMVADPLHVLDCCVISDGGGAFIMTSEERARDLRQPPVYVLGAAGSQHHWNISQMRDFSTSAAVPCGRAAFEEAGLRPSDIDTVQLYDSFTITVLMLLEDLGFCPKGEGGRFVSEGLLRRGGAMPLNTDGGGLSSNHPGMRGIFLIIEAVRQLRGQAGEAQVANCKTALAGGSGGWLSAIGVAILGSEAPQ